VRRRGGKKVDGTGGQGEQALGRSRGGFGTKIHAAVSGLGLPVRLTLSPGQDADITHADALLDGFTPAVVIGDKGYDKQALVDAIEANGGEAVIPTLKTRKVQRGIDTDRYKDRNLVERFWATMKVCRRVATRYEKTARNFLAFVHVAATMVLLR
jgi:transposase